MSYIVDSCSLTKLTGGVSKLNSADDDAVSWLTNYGCPYRMHTTTTLHKCPAVAEMGDHLATIDIGQKEGGCRASYPTV